jgi:reactive chlorine resistance protein C
VFSIRSFSALLGVTEIVIAPLIAARPLSAGAALVGSALAAGMFLTTLSFLLTTPGVWEVSAGGFPALSVVPGQFLDVRRGLARTNNQPISSVTSQVTTTPKLNSKS